MNNLKSILTQDHLATSDPIYVVFSKREVVVDRDFDYDKIVYVRDEDELSFEEFESLESSFLRARNYRFFNINGEQESLEAPKDPFNEDKEFNPHDWKPLYIKLIDKFEQAFFIRENAENYLLSNKHNLGESAYIYVESAHRNPEWQAIREMLIKLAQETK